MVRYSRLRGMMRIGVLGGLISMTTAATAEDYLTAKGGLFYGLERAVFGSNSAAWRVTFSTLAQHVAPTNNYVPNYRYYGYANVGCPTSGTGDEQVWRGQINNSAEVTGNETLPTGLTNPQTPVKKYFMWVVPETWTDTALASRATYSVVNQIGRFNQVIGTMVDPTPERALIPMKDLNQTGYVFFAKAFLIPESVDRALTITLPYNSGGNTFCAYYITQVKITYTTPNNSTIDIVSYHQDMVKFRTSPGSVKIRSVDSRVTYGQPDLPGGVDPNSGIGFVKFNNWNYGGGLFIGTGEATEGGNQVGNEDPPPHAKKDKSGNARIIARPNSISAPSGYDKESCTLGLFDLGIPNRPAGMYTKNSMNIQCEYGGDYQNTNEASWDNALSFANTGDSIANGTNRELDAISGTNSPTREVLGNSATEKYYFWGSKDFEVSSSTPKLFQLRLENEPTIGFWRYFVSQPYVDKLSSGGFTTLANDYTAKLPLAGWAFKGTTTYTND